MILQHLIILTFAINIISNIYGMEFLDLDNKQKDYNNLDLLDYTTVNTQAIGCKACIENTLSKHLIATSKDAFTFYTYRNSPKITLFWEELFACFFIDSDIPKDHAKNAHNLLGETKTKTEPSDLTDLKKTLLLLNPPPTTYLDRTYQEQFMSFITIKNSSILKNLCIFKEKVIKQITYRCAFCIDTKLLTSPCHKMTITDYAETHFENYNQYEQHLEEYHQDQIKLGKQEYVSSKKTTALKKKKVTISTKLKVCKKAKCLTQNTGHQLQHLRRCHTFSHQKKLTPIRRNILLKENILEGLKSKEYVMCTNCFKNNYSERSVHPYSIGKITYKTTLGALSLNRICPECKETLSNANRKTLDKLEQLLEDTLGINIL